MNVAASLRVAVPWRAPAATHPNAGQARHD